MNQNESKWNENESENIHIGKVCIKQNMYLLFRYACYNIYLK